MTSVNDTLLVGTGWLELHLNDPDLRILDCTVYLPNYFDESASKGVRIVPGWEDFERGHIPGSSYVDLAGELTDRDNKRFMFPMPPTSQFAGSMSRHGVGPGTRVVLYDRVVSCWATRVWWMLRAFGFDNAAVLDGGWKKWTAEGRPVSTQPPAYAPAKFIADPRPELIAAKDEVIAAIGDPETCILNALDPEEYAGRGPVRYGRPGHIPSSVNVWCLNLVDPQNNAFLPAEKLREQFAAVGALDKKKVIVYCGGAIAATADAFVLTLLGADNIAVYDGSMTEWAADPALPLEKGN